MGVKLRNENREIEEKLREALGTAQHRGEVIKQLRDDLKAAGGKVGCTLLFLCCKCMHSKTWQNRMMKNTHIVGV